MPTRPQRAPIALESHSIVAKRWVSIRATTAGITRVAATSVTPITESVARIASESTSMSRASVRATRTPLTSATSGSKVAKSSAR